MVPLAIGPWAGGGQIVGLLRLRATAGACALAASLLMSFGGAVAVADPDSSGSAAHGTDTNRPHSTGPEKPTKAGTDAKDEKKDPGGTDGKDQKKDPDGTDGEDQKKDPDGTDAKTKDRVARRGRRGGGPGTKGKTARFGVGGVGCRWCGGVGLPMVGGVGLRWFGGVGCRGAGAPVADGAGASAADGVVAPVADGVVAPVVVAPAPVAVATARLRTARLRCGGAAPLRTRRRWTSRRRRLGCGRGAVESRWRRLRLVAELRMRSRRTPMRGACTYAVTQAPSHRARRFLTSSRRQDKLCRLDPCGGAGSRCGRGDSGHVTRLPMRSRLAAAVRRLRAEAPAPDAVAPVSDVIASIQDMLSSAPAPDAVAPAPDAVASIQDMLTPVADAGAARSMRWPCDNAVTPAPRCGGERWREAAAVAGGRVGFDIPRWQPH